MATKRRKPRTVADENYSELDMYCIWLHEYHRALRRAGFSNDNALWIISTKDSYPEWVLYKIPNETDIANLLDEDED
jgi:hypothetical protein